MSRREINNCLLWIENHPIDSFEDVLGWLQDKANDYQLKYLLAHADDGVIWGRLIDGRLVTSRDAAQEYREEIQEISPPLRHETLQQARLFGPNAELMLWRDGDNNWWERLIQDEESQESGTIEYFDENQILWGTDPILLDYGFALMSDGQRGHQHIVPIEISGQYNEVSRPLRLCLRHYLAQSRNGFLYVNVSRLADLRTQESA